MAGQKNNGGRADRRPAAEATGRDGTILPPGPAIPRQVAGTARRVVRQCLLPFHRTTESATGRPDRTPESKTRRAPTARLVRLPGRTRGKASLPSAGSNPNALKTGRYGGTKELRRMESTSYFNLFTCWF